ncbi:CpXC domain-containing protein [uncultured Sphaerochaeta sp.]|uniref:CpXC domain-containing protein n=1 Tax=uncultured Sphaerochaeta sp. TaxID=886478 RepID=UPI002A0A4FF2|nr:CpXC domain-containing protein [uncultured Sphaerochaeta sp.]
MQDVTLTCPHCKKQHPHTLTPFIDLKKQPKQRLGILTDSLFSVTCPACKRQYTVLHELLVVEETTKWAIMLIPDTEHEQVDGKVTGREDLDSYTLRLVSATAALKEKLLIWEQGLDDRSLELCKLYLSLQLQEPDYQLFFTEQRKEENSLYFTVLGQDGSLEGSISCEYGLYSQLHENAASFPLQKGYFIRVDSQWAEKNIRNNAAQ